MTEPQDQQGQPPYGQQPPYVQQQQPYGQPPSGGPYAQQPAAVGRRRKKSGLLWLLSLVGLAMVAGAIFIGVSAFSWMFDAKPVELPREGSRVIDLQAGGYVIASENRGSGRIEAYNVATDEPLPKEMFTGELSFNDYQGLYGFVLEEPTSVRFEVVGGDPGASVLFRYSPDEFAELIMGMAGKFVGAAALGGLGLLMALVFGIWAVVRTFGGSSAASR